MFISNLTACGDWTKFVLSCQIPQYVDRFAHLRVKHPYPAHGDAMVKCAGCLLTFNIKYAIWYGWSRCKKTRQPNPDCPTCINHHEQLFFCSSDIRPPLYLSRIAPCHRVFCDREDEVCRRALIERIDNHGWSAEHRCWYCGDQCSGERVSYSSGYEVMHYQTCAPCRPKDPTDSDNHWDWQCRGGCGRDFTPVCGPDGSLLRYDMFNHELQPKFERLSTERLIWDSSHWCLWRKKLHEANSLWTFGRPAEAGNVRIQKNQYCAECLQAARTKRCETPLHKQRKLNPQ